MRLEANTCVLRAFSLRSRPEGEASTRYIYLQPESLTRVAEEEGRV